MQTFKAIKKRRSVREYAKKAVPRGLLKKLVDAARFAPTARGVEPWDFVIIQQQKTLDEISRLAPNGAFIKNAAAAIVVFSQDTKYYIEDCSAASENILLMASDSGIGACWIAGDKKDYAAVIERLLNCPKGHKLVSIISLGIPSKKQAPGKKKRALDSVIHWETF
ncbi:MAG: nitroreductase family protein [Candidatus Omnitrophica bacterium]|jgi:nitroreductase|nr:nitroreductase family protein [Candidatus Omnitrophota bacterium]